MRTRLTVFSLLLMLVFSTISAGCMGLVMQREIMEDMREEPFVNNKEESFFWEVMFTSESLDLESVQYTNETQSCLTRQYQRCLLPSVLNSLILLSLISMKAMTSICRSQGLGAWCKGIWR